MSLRLPPRKTQPYWSLTPNKLNLLDWFILFGEENGTYTTFFPTLTPVAAKREGRAVIGSTEGREYIAIREKQLEEFFRPPKVELTEGQKEERAQGFSENFANKVMQKIETEIDNPDSAIYMDVLKLSANKVFKDMELTDMVEPPRRYLATGCLQCTYRLFCETECINECQYCKYREYANENGVVYTHKDQLSIPKEKLERLNIQGRGYSSIEEYQEDEDH